MTNFRIPYARHLGAGSQSAFRDGDVTDAKFREIGGAPGMVFPFEGNLFAVYRNRNGSALAEGEIIKLYFNAAARTGTASAGAADQFTSADTFTAGELVDKSVASYVFITGGTGPGQRRKITRHASGANAIVYVADYDRSLNLAAASAADKFATVPDATSTYSIVLPWEIVKHSAVGDWIVGVSLSAVTDGNWSVFQIGGFSLVKSVGSTDALVAGSTFVPSATAGVAKGFTTAGETVAEARLSFGMPIDAYSGAAALRHGIIRPPFGRLFYPDTL